jgi:hypothetical protein
VSIEQGEIPSCKFSYREEVAVFLGKKNFLTGQFRRVHLQRFTMSESWEVRIIDRNMNEKVG